MRRAWLVGLLVVMGCSQGISIEVRVDPSAPADEVELFLGLVSCPDCPPIRPENYPFALAGDVYYRDHADAFVTGVVDGSAWFVINPTAQGDYLARVLAVGRDTTTGSQTSAAITTNLDLTDTARWIIDLVPASQELRVNSAGAADGSYAKIWHETKAPNASCIGFERWQGGQLDTRTFIVPEDDPDCDDFTVGNGECNAYEHLGFVGPTQLDQMSCVTMPTADPNGPCTLGGPTCVDGMGKLDCGTSNYCVPSTLCSACKAAGTQAELMGCASGVFADTTGGTALICSVPVELDGNNGTYRLCPTAEMANVDLSARFPNGCRQPRFTTMPTTVTASTSWQPFEDKLRLPVGASELVLETDAPSATCVIPFRWSGDVATAGAALPLALIDLEAPGGMGPTNHVLLPLKIMATSCGLPAGCRIDSPSTEQVFACASAPRTITFGERPGATHDNVTLDTYVDQRAESTPYPGDPTMLVNGAKHAVALLRFDVSAVPPSAVVVSARLRIGSTISDGFSVHLVNQSWSLDATWGASGLGPWLGSGFGPSYAASIHTVPATSGFADNVIPLPPTLVQGWVMMPSSNFGIALVGAQASSIDTTLIASESTMINRRPVLELTIQ